ncbi:zf-HC2 domain-containing protein [Siminovitchia sp. FSL W7-1587]|uniref:zf-HC2 domain-containing protein n=1 Tax=Siminovitchia sp. FSL W7-1587 TaxID=2954699 RepID=UPI0030CEA8A1
MNHSVFRDLVPNYIENLTTEETNRQMEKHMEQCEDCREYVKEMREDLSIERRNEQKEENRNIDYLKKVRLKNRKKIITITGALLSLFLVLSISYYFLFVHMWMADKNDVETTIQQQDSKVTLTFQSKNDNRYLLAVGNQTAKHDYTDFITIYESWNVFSDTKLNPFSELAKARQNGDKISYVFLDENTLLLDNGEKKKLTDEDKITIEYKDHSEVIRLKDLYRAKNNN